MASVRYIANDIDKSVEFYRDRLGFEVEKHNPGKFAEMTLEDLHLSSMRPELAVQGKQEGILSQVGGTGSWS